MSCYVMLRYVMICYVMICYVMICYVHIMLHYCILLYYITLYCVILSSVILYIDNTWSLYDTCEALKHTPTQTIIIALRANFRVYNIAHFIRLFVTVIVMDSHFILVSTVLLSHLYGVINYAE